MRYWRRMSDADAALSVRFVIGSMLYMYAWPTHLIGDYLVCAQKHEKHFENMNVKLEFRLG